MFKRPAEIDDKGIWYFPIKKTGHGGFRAGEEPSVPPKLCPGLWGAPKRARLEAGSVGGDRVAPVVQGVQTETWAEARAGEMGLGGKTAKRLSRKDLQNWVSGGMWGARGSVEGHGEN